MKIAANRHDGLAITGHWVMVLLIVAVYTCILLSENFAKGSDTRIGLMTWHFILGLSVLALVTVRLLLVLIHRTPHIGTPVKDKPVSDPPVVRWQSVLSHCVHALLYLSMVVIPLLGWLALSASGKPILLYGWHLPSLITENANLVHTLKELHEAAANALYFLVGLHALAALYHHYFLRDNTLRRMLP